MTTTEETASQRLNRELEQLLQELRVLIPGAQVLFAFLLTVPFSQRFQTLTDGERGLFVTALVCIAVATVLLVAPSAAHRILFRRGHKEWIIRRGTAYAIAGTGFLAIAVACSLYLVVELVYGSLLAAILAAGLSIVCITLWYVIPIVRLRRLDYPLGAPEKEER